MAEPVRLLILGTGTVGASIGLALGRAGQNFDRVGYDPRSQKAQQAHKAGAVDRLVHQPARAAGEADLVLLTLPPTQAVDAAAAIAGNLRPETVVLCTFHLQAKSMEEVREKLGPANPCLGTVPFLGPQRALAQDGDPDAPSADAFRGGMLGIVAPAGTAQGAIEIGLDLAAILGATPFFLEPAELDSVTATSEQLPAVLAAALLESLTANPGWRDQQRLVGRPFARLASLLAGSSAEAAAEWVANRGPLIARLDAIGEEVANLRDLLAAGDEGALSERLEEATTRYQEWRGVRAASRPDHGVDFGDVPRANLFDRLLGSRPSKKKT
ncbi:MAG: putative prephenate dehydrogenase [Anaerolineales bacterium]|nr:putative prephenate dehydrogenase [Anaerolineales bacterium]